jgi:hypothetical protein
MKNRLKLRYSLIFIIIIILFSQHFIIIETNAAEQGFRLFRFETDTEFLINDDSVINNPVLPGNSEEINLTIRFRYILPQFFLPILTGTRIGNWIMFRDMNSNMQVSLDFEVTYPDFCKLELKDNKAIISNISTNFKEFKTRFNISIKENTEAFNTGIINISAKFIPESNWALEPSEDSYNFNITVDYYSNLSVNSTKHELIPPLIETVIPIYIENHGNANLVVNSTVDYLDRWNIDIIKPNFTLNKTETEILYVNVIPPKKFDIEDVEFEFRTYPKDKNLNEYDSIILWNITLENDGSYKKEEAFSINYLIVILAIIIIICCVIMFKKLR